MHHSIVKPPCSNLMGITATFSGIRIFRNFTIMHFKLNETSACRSVLPVFPQLRITRFEPRHDKTNKMSVRPAKTQISLGIRPVWSESSLYAQRVAKDPSFFHADSEDSDQTRRMPRLIWSFAGSTTTLLVLSCHGSFIIAVHEAELRMLDSRLHVR